jgi:hypothetical protein
LPGCPGLAAGGRTAKPSPGDGGEALIHADFFIGLINDLH